MTSSLVVGLVLLAAVCGALAVSHPDEVQFPWLKQLPSRQYSGYLVLDNENSLSPKKIHYWFIESQDNPRNDPVVLWLNGGPGCSSLLGCLEELGPFHINCQSNNTTQCTFEENIYSWTRRANVIFMEAPVGVGFSYIPQHKLYENDDDSTAVDNYHALLKFFEEFKEFRKNRFLVTGESYAGVYVPTLVKLIHEGNSRETHNFINLEGLAVGNGVTSWNTNFNSAVFFAYYHGLFSLTLWDNLVEFCCQGKASRRTCDFRENPNQLCQKYSLQAQQSIYESGINIYGIYKKCEHDPTSYLRMESMITREKPPQKISINMDSSTEDDVPCMSMHGPTIFLNDPVVRKALHIPEEAPRWNACSGFPNFQYTRNYETVMPIYAELLKMNYRILIYNGDTDLVCNFLGAQWDFEGLNRTVKSEYRSWKVDGQVAGFVKEFNGLTLLTVKGSGHMVPQFRPKAALSMFESFIDNVDYGTNDHMDVIYPS
uniref:Carboxypeptidase n=1 Tax=Hirondellea gigas TaxID=1518452 RepID=A0A2P2I6N2_9CRUS